MIVLKLRGAGQRMRARVAFCKARSPTECPGEAESLATHYLPSAAGFPSKEPRVAESIQPAVARPDIFDKWISGRYASLCSSVSRKNSALVTV